MAKRKSKPVLIVFSIILAVAFIVLSLFTFGQFNLKRARVYSGIFSLVEIGSDINDTVVVSYALAEEEGDVDRASIEKSVEVIRNRLNIPEFATSTVKATDNGFIVELPNSENTSFALNYFFGQGKMSFKTTTNEYLTEKDVTGATVQEAYEQDGINVTASGYSIAIHFTKHGQAQFYEATKEVYEDNGSITIEMDGNTLSQASVNEKINSSSVQISGNYTKEQAQIIASAINNGVLANSFEKQGTEKQASSILGEKAGLKIVLGLLAILVVVAVLFVIFYKGLGVVADLVLLVSVELFALVFALIPGSIITIPALIGIVIAFAVLCAILVTIFERVKAEFALGKTINSSISYGFNKSYMFAIDVAIVAIIVFLSSYFVVGAYVQTFIAALSVALGVVAFTSWIITRGIIALFKGFVNQETFYNLVKEEEAE